MKKNMLITIFTIFLLCFISVAYAAFNSELTITGEGTVQKDTTAPTCGSWYLRDSSLTIQDAYDQNKFINPGTNTTWTTTNKKLFIECSDNMVGSYGCINVTEITDSNNNKRYFKEVKEYTTSIQSDGAVSVVLEDAYHNQKTCSLPAGGSNPYIDKQGPTVTITQSAANKFTYSATDDIGVTGYQVTTTSTQPAINDANWGSTPSEVTIDNTAAKTYYVWAKDGVNVSYSSIQTFKLTKSQGTGTTLTLKYNNNSGATLGTQFVLSGTRVYVTGSLKTGYNTLVLKKGSTSISSGSTQTITAATTISSTSTVNTYTIIFDKNANDATGTMSGQIMTYDTSATLTPNAFTRPGYSFKEWNTQANGTGTSYADEASVSNLATSGTFNLYAQWSERAKFDTGTNVTVKMKQLAGDSTITDQNILDSDHYNTNITSIVKSNTEPSASNKTSEHIVSAQDSNVPIYMWFDSTTGTMYWWSEDSNPYLNEDSSLMFSALTAATSIDVTYFDTSLVENMYAMFAEDHSLTSIDLSNFDTSNVVNFSAMFANNYSLSSVDLSSFDMTNAEENWYMFFNDNENLGILMTLVTPNTYPSDTSVVMDLPGYFRDSNSNTYNELDYTSPTSTTLTRNIAIFDTGANVNIKLKTLAGQTNPTVNTVNNNIKEIAWAEEEPSASNKTSSHIISASTSAYPIYAWFDNGTMYVWCEDDAPFFNSNSESFFNSLSALGDIDFWANPVLLQDVDYMFKNCSSLTYLNLSVYISNNVASTADMLDGMSSLDEIYTPNIYPSSSSVSIDLPRVFAVENTVTPIYTYLDNTSPASTNMYRLFTEFDTGTNVNVKMKQLAGDSTITDQNVGDSDHYNTNITSIVKSNTEPSASNKTSEHIVSSQNSNLPIYMWYDNGTIYWWSADPNPYLNSNSSGMFEYLKNLTSIDLTHFNTSNVTDMSWMFDDDNALTSVDLSNFNTSNVTNFAGMFAYCYSLTSIDLSSFDMTNAQDNGYMFAVTSIMTLTTPNSFPADSSVIMDLPCAFIDTSSNTYTELDSTSPTSATLTRKYALLDTGANVNTKLKALAGQTNPTVNTVNTNITGINWSSEEPSAANKTSSHVISASTSGYPIYAWFDNGIINIWADTSDENIFLNPNSESLFNSLSSLENVNINSHFVLLQDVDYMFKNCSSLDAVDLFSYYWSNVTSSTDMLDGMDSLVTIYTPSAYPTNANVRIELPSTFIDESNNTYTYLNNTSPTGATIHKLYSKFDIGENVNVKMKTLAGNANPTTNTLDTSINSITRSSTEPSSAIMNDSNHIVSSSDSTIPIYMWFDNGTMYWWSIAEHPYFNENAFHMFEGLTSATTIDVSPFDTSRSTDMGALFKGDSSLLALDLSNFDTSKNLYFDFMFNGCSSITSLDLSSFDMSNVTEYINMFNGMVSLVDLKTPNTLFSDTSYAIDLPYTMKGTNNVDYTSIAYNTPTSMWLHTNGAITVTFDAAGGSVSPSTKQVITGGVYGNLPTPTKAGYGFAGWSDSRLPAGYTEVEYIESSGTQWIDTGVTPSTTLKMQYRFRPLSLLNSTVLFLGVRGSSNASWGLAYQSGASLRFYEVNSSSARVTTSSNYITTGTDYNLEVGNLYIKNLDTGSNVVTGTTQSSATTNIGTIKINNSYNSNYASMRTYSIKIYDGNTLIRDFVPCIKESTGKAGLYDLANNTFYGNSGSGNFTAGSAVGGGYVTSSTVVTKTANHTLHANWVELVTVTFNPNGGTVSPSIKQVMPGAPYGELPTPTKTGYIFKGWTIDSLLPSGYSELDYIESTGTQYIDTGYSFYNDQAGGIEAEFAYTEAPSSGYYYLYGVENTSEPFGAIATRVHASYPDTVQIMAYTTGMNGSISLNTRNTLSNFFSNNTSHVTYNGVSATAIKNETLSNGNLYLFAANISGATRHGKTRIYSFRIYNGSNTLVRNFIPCINESTGKAGLYDLVNGVFYGNSGTGDFIEGPSRHVSSNDLVTKTTSHILTADWEAITPDITWDFNDSNNMKTWLYQGVDTFTVSYNSADKMNDVSVYGAGGVWEIVYIPISTTANKDYKVEFDYLNTAGYTPLTGYSGIGVQALTAIANSDNASNSLNTVILSPTANPNVQHITFEFTATGSTTYLAFNFGMTADSATTAVKFGNFKIVDTLTYGTKLSSIPTLSPNGATFSGYYTAASGGTQVTTTDDTPYVDTTYYAHSSLTTYNISYTLNGGTVSPANPTTYSVDTLPITLTNPTRSGYTFAGWAGSNDLSTGLDGYTTSNPYTAGSRDNMFGNEFDVVSGQTYRVFVTAKKTAGTINMQGGIWYTVYSSGTAYEGVGGVFTKCEDLSDGWAIYYKDVTVPTGKTKGKIYVQLEQQSGSYTTTWLLADAHVIQGTSVTLPKGTTGNKSYKAYFIPNDYTLTINPNGGSISGKTTSYTVVKKKDEIIEVPLPTRTGYTFTGWTKSGSGTLTKYGVGKYNDYGFTSSNNSITVYNNAGGGTVTHTKIATTSDNPMKDASYVIQVTTNGAASPGLGGIIQNTQSRANAVFYHVIVAKVPVGYNLHYAYNPTGDGNSVEWLTSSAGTGKYETYVYKHTCGSSGTFSTFGHVYLSADPANTWDVRAAESGNITWYVAYANVFDYTAGPNANDGQIYTFGQGNATLTAAWAANSFTIAYNANGGSGTVSSHSCTYGGTCNLKSNSFSRSGYIFTGWKLNNSGSIIQPGTNVSTAVTSGTATYYAQWTKVDGTSKTFNYTGAVQTYTAPSAGTYKLEVCGAQGGSVSVAGLSKTGGKGGCATGNVSLSAGQTLYVFVGGAGGSTAGNTGAKAGGYNGGGSTGGTNVATYQGAGGGATHISKSNATIANSGSNLLIVGGGGGGADIYYASDGTTTSHWFDGDGGNGGGSSGGTGVCHDMRNGNCYGAAGTGGSQSSGGGGGSSGSKGQGGSGGSTGGGGGYYGGGGGSNAGAGGGSGYINGSLSSRAWSSSSCANSSGLRTGNGCAKITKQ